MQTLNQSIQTLIDQKERDLFANEIDVNFSIIAPAGVGKTTAIVQRILTIANSSDYNILPSRLSKLVVVTYTQKAANEMRLRAYQALLKANTHSQAIHEFNKAFFGTIHSFCLNIIKSYGVQIGIPNNILLLTNDEKLWNEFINTEDVFTDVVHLDIKEGLYRHINLSQLIQLARTSKLNLKTNNQLGNCPKPDVGALINYIPKKISKKIIEFQKKLQRWLLEYQNHSLALEIPEIGEFEEDFKELYAKTFAPLWHWLGDASLIFILALAKKYQLFRIQKGYITYDDIIDLASQLLSIKEISSEIHASDYHVILDEAQDTDAQQFSILFQSIQCNRQGFPLEGRFSMLGDPQQAIYSERADLPTYLKTHDDLLSSNTAKTLTFNVTMRCDSAIVAHCNALFPSILKTKNTLSQINFVPLNPRPWAGRGFVGRIYIDPPNNSQGKLHAHELEKYEALILAQKIHSLGLKGLGISDWSELAILCPRKSWLTPIASALEALDIRTQIHSNHNTKGDNPAFAWLLGLLTVITSPNNSFELVGVLREIFGITDEEIALFASHWNRDKSTLHPLNISQAKSLHQDSRLHNALNLLQLTRNESLYLPLSEGVRKIVEETELKTRLTSLPEYKTDHLLNALDSLLIQATIMEEQGFTLIEFTQFLKDQYKDADTSEVCLEGHIQFYTSHKAKGLEWSVVIVPFLFRSIVFPPQPYPQLFSLGSEYSPKIAVVNHPDKVEFDFLLNQYRVSELERLLYVTATRARNSIIWVDDESLFPNAKNAFASLLKITPGNINRHIWSGLTTKIDISGNEKTFPHSLPINLNTHSVSPFNPGIIQDAKVLAENFIRPISPNHLNNLSFLETIKKPPKNYSSIEYGNWWHKLMQTLPWYDKIQKWKDHLILHLASCPEPFRGESEFQAFLKSSLVNQLTDSSLYFYTEFSFSFKEQQESTYFQGIIDLLIYSPKTDDYLIIDWKTDLFETDYDALTLLKHAYSPQLNVYKELIKEVHQKSSKAFIFSTVLSKTVEC